MGKNSGGILVYRRKNDTVEVLLGHPGGPFWAKKDDGSWDIPKGELDEGEAEIAAARREFAEELGSSCPEGELVELGSLKRKSGTLVFIWAVEGDFDVSTVRSNTFTMEWPPKSGQSKEFPEIDRAAWFTIEQARVKIQPGLSEFITRLAQKLAIVLSEYVGDEQGTLF